MRSRGLRSMQVGGAGRTEQSRGEDRRSSGAGDLAACTPQARDGGPAQLFPHRPAHYSAPRRAAQLAWARTGTGTGPGQLARAAGRARTCAQGRQCQSSPRRPPCHGHRRCRSNVHRGGSGTGVSARAPIMTRLVRLVASWDPVHGAARTRQWADTGACSSVFMQLGVC